MSPKIRKATQSLINTGMNFVYRNAMNKPNYTTIAEDSQGETVYVPISTRRMSWPFEEFDAPPLLDGTLPGDAGFDPLNVVRCSEDLFVLREAEIKHSRIAMLASVGWPVSELYHYQLSQTLGLEDLLVEGGKVPSVLNGGLDNAYVLFSFGVFFAVGGVLELELKRRRKEKPEMLKNFYDLFLESDWNAPGNYGFDPLGLSKWFCDSEESKLVTQTVELFNGRVAMLAVVGFAVQELVTGLPVVRETPQFF